MTQNQKFSVKPPSRLEAIAHHADEKEGDCDHQRGSCSDSGTAATPADGVFGSDNAFCITERCTLASSSPTVWCHCRYSHLGRAASPIRPDMIFGKDRLLMAPFGHASPSNARRLGTPPNNAAVSQFKNKASSLTESE